MDVLLRAASDRLAKVEPSCCDPDSLARETGIDPEVARALLPTTKAVLQTVAENALRRQLDHLTRQLSGVSDQSPAQQLVALGRAYAEWATRNVNDFRVLNSKLVTGAIDKDEITRYHHGLQQLTVSMLKRARERGQLRPDLDISVLSLVARAFSYGIARLYVDRQLNLWEGAEPDQDESARMDAAIEAFAEMLLMGWQSDQPIRSEA